MINSLFEKEKKWLLNEKYNGKKSKDFFTDIEKLRNKEPLAFLIGFVYFINCKIDLSFKPLIPRVETEFWVKDFIDEQIKNDNSYSFFLNNSNKISILDIFSGSGCIGISLLKNLKNVEVDFSEINPYFIQQIKKNLKVNNIKKDFGRVFKSDIFKSISKKKYDYILANPPYIPKSKKVDSSVINFEDCHSLFAKDNGLYFIKRLILESPNYLKKDGQVLIEFDETSKKSIEDFLIKKKIQKYSFKKDQYLKNRILILKL